MERFASGVSGRVLQSFRQEQVRMQYCFRKAHLAGNGVEMGDGERKVSVVSKGNWRAPRADGTVVCLDCTNVNILVLVVYYHFSTSYYWKKGVG